MNSVVLIGRLTRDPEVRYTAGTQMAVCTFTVAIDRPVRAGGEKQTDFFDCVFWRQSAEFLSKYFSKGKEIIVQGEMQSRKWQDKDGNNRISWEIQNAHAEFCGGKGDNSAPAEPASDFAVIDDISSDLPF